MIYFHKEIYFIIILLYFFVIEIFNFIFFFSFIFDRIIQRIEKLFIEIFNKLVVLN